MVCSPRRRVFAPLVPKEGPVSVFSKRTRLRRIPVVVKVLAVVALAASGFALFTPSGAGAASNNVLIKGVGSGRCLTPQGQSNATIQDCASQRWSVTDSGTITINGQCLDAKGQGTANGTVVQVFSCNGGSNQQWTVGSDGSIKGAQSGRCLDVNAELTAAGTKVQLWDCHGGSNQKWTLVGDGGTTPPTTTPPTTTPPTTTPPGGETVGGGTLTSPAVGPGPSSGVFGSGFTLIKNYNFGANGTIRNQSDMNQQFVYHDQFNTIGNGTNYGAITLAPDSADAISGQPVQDPNNPVRIFTGDSLKTTLVPLNGATTVSPTQHNVGNGSFQPKFTLPAGGSRLGHDILWETRVKYVTPRYFWFALWNSGNQWDGGAEFDVVESFGYDNGGGNTNFDGRFWHADPVGGTSTTDYSNWGQGMASHGINSYDATQYHTWSLLYKKDNSYTFYVDGIAVQSGSMQWTLGGGASGTPIDFHFLFDAGWGHTQVASVNHSMPASELTGKSYEFDWSHVYER
jgi:Ricin-type beta-trefoil lectin domain